MKLNTGKSQSRRAGRQAPPPLILSRTRAMSSGPNKISRSPTRPEPDDDGEEWPVHGIVGEDVDVFGISRYSLYCCSHWQYRTELKPPVTRQAQALSFSHSTLRIDNHLRYTQNWTRPDGTNTTWMRDIEGDPAIIASWNEAMKNQRLEKAMETQSIDLNRAQVVEEKMAERLRKGWPTTSDGKPPSSKNSSKKRKRPSLSRVREASHAESSRSAASRKRRIPVAQDNDGETSTASDSDIDSVMLLGNYYVSAESFTMLTKQGNGTDSFRNPPLAATDELVPSRAEPSEVAAWKPVDVC
ncbi:hypothetical protein DFH94DRAFT_747477 [Russula ochroleuca]|uniref:Uncharacterized protein n=1 Tax=Russula ochroleuca TaxID=152965 RepID=A0A9P5T861_9AGAM|nr:hypothetical protein DFH94DRAFT_747477 [Russula ochroleuca]